MYRIKKKKTWTAVGFIMAFLAIASIGLGVGYAGAKLSNQSLEEEQENSSPPPVTENTFLNEDSTVASKTLETEVKETTPPKNDEFMYLIALEGNKTNVYTLSDNKKLFSHSLPVEPNSLRKEDISMLKEGVFLKNKDELLSFIEDFCS